MVAFSVLDLPGGCSCVVQHAFAPGALLHRAAVYGCGVALARGEPNASCLPARPFGAPVLNVRLVCLFGVFVWTVRFQAVVCRAVRLRMQFSGGEKFKGRKGVACRKSHCMSVPAGTGLAKKKPAQASCRKPYVALFRLSVGVHFHLADVDCAAVSHARHHERGITSLAAQTRYVGISLAVAACCQTGFEER